MSNLNGNNFGPEQTPYAIGIVWHTITDYNKSLETVEMAIKGILGLLKVTTGTINRVLLE